MVPTSEDLSSEDDNPEARGINVASQTLSEGAFLYLQSMKTFVIMFFILSIINLPVLMINHSNTSNNDFGNLGQVWKYFTIGNLGLSDSNCDHSLVEFQDMDTTLKNIKLSCPDGKYIKGLKHFGFLYHLDKRINAPSDAFSFCYKAENPLATDTFIL